MENNLLAAEEARRELQRESVKSQVESGVNAEIAARADQATPAQAQEMEQVAGGLRGQAMAEIVTTEREVARGRGAARVSQVVDYLFFVIYALLALRLLLALLSARSNAGFVQFIRALTEPLYAPFRGIVASPTAEGGYTLALPIVLAIFVYALLHLGLNGFLRLIASRKTEI